MKREYKEKKIIYSHLWSYFPILVWKECFLCHREFVREWGWKVFTYPITNGAYTARYVCNECGKTKESISEILLNHRFGIGQKRVNILT